MAVSKEELDEKQATYKAAVDAWVAAIRHEEELASVEHSVADLDAWGAASDKEEELREAAKDAKQVYEDVLREEFFGF